MGRGNMTFQDSLEDILRNKEEILAEGYRYEKDLRGKAEDVLNRRLSFERAVYNMVDVFDYDKWFIANDLRSVIRELVPLKDDNRDG
tara:strand:- start:22 stop:282 length:261 start_codon:yes stop_codon:yes gene_type:complete